MRNDEIVKILQGRRIAIPKHIFDTLKLKDGDIVKVSLWDDNNINIMACEVIPKVRHTV